MINREKARASNARYEAKYPERKRARDAKWRIENPEKARAKNARYRARHPEKIRAKNAKHNAANCEKLRLKSAKYRVEHPEKKRAYEAKRRATKRTQRCACCTDWQIYEEFYIHTSEGMEVDHIIPLALGGLHCRWNLQLLTKADHKIKSAKDMRLIAQFKRSNKPKTVR